MTTIIIQENGAMFALYSVYGYIPIYQYDSNGLNDFRLSDDGCLFPSLYNMTTI